MKHKILFFGVALFFLSACGSVAPLVSPEASVNIRVECRDDPGIRQMVLGMLRQAKARDVRETKTPSYLEIQASYYADDNSPGKLNDIANLLELQNGVLYVEMQENHSVIKQAR